MLPLVVQAIRRGDPVVDWIDLKGDDAAHETLRIETERAGRVFKDYTLESGKASYLFEPFDQPEWKVLSITEKTQLFLGCLGLAHHDDETGKVYYEGCSGTVVQEAFKLYPNIRSIRELNAIVKSKRFRDQLGMNRRDFENAGALFNYLRIASEPEQLNAVPGDGHPDAVFRDAIYLKECRARPCVTYWRLAGMIEPRTNKLIARLVILFHCAGARMGTPSPYQHYICIDEFPEIVQQALTTPIKQARDLGITFFLAMQSLSDLIKPELNALDTVVGNTSMRDFFSAYEAFTRQHLSAVSGQDYVTLESRACTDHLEGPANGNAESWTKSYTTSESQREAIKDRFDSNVLNFVNSRRELSIIEAAPMSGFTRIRHPVIVESIPMTTEEEYERRKNTPWPSQTESTILGPPPAPAIPAPGPSPSKPRKKPRRTSSTAKADAAAEMAKHLRQLVFPTEPQSTDPPKEQP